MMKKPRSKLRIIGALAVIAAVTLVLMSVLYVMTIGFGSGGGDSYTPLPYPYPSPQPTPAPINYEMDTTEQFLEAYSSGEYIDTEDNPVSTFGADVDTGSYVLARSSINSGITPQPGTVRTEEFLNYFDYNYPEDEDSDFTIHMECGPSYFSDGYHMLKIGVKAKSMSTEDRPSMLFIAVVDMSGSMASAGKLSLIREALPYLVNQMQEGDRFGIVVYDSTARDYLEPLGASDKELIISKISEFRADGSTNAHDGLKKGYEMALENRRVGEPCRLLLLSDGVANTGISDTQGLVAMIQDYKNMGVYLSTYGFGMGEYNDQLMEQLADNGDGRYAYIDDIDEAKKEFIEDLTGNMISVAKDLKLQVEFNPRVIEEYRLLGYENRLMTEEEFRDKSKDSGDIGAGHTVTALYEIKLKSTHGDLGSLELRYKNLENSMSLRKVYDIKDSCFTQDIGDTSPQFRFALCVAEFAEHLKDSEFSDSSIKEIRELAVEALDEYRFKGQSEKDFIELLEYP
ncbi:MAG: von Willebrand factor type A domain-containing protein [Thermoplasmata archaeon]|nr:von Willebrand factor type A domain-containing protein [Thermoplasmata archaeon]